MNMVHSLLVDALRYYDMKYNAFNVDMMRCAHAPAQASLRFSKFTCNISHHKALHFVGNSLPAAQHWFD